MNASFIIQVPLSKKPKPHLPHESSPVAKTFKNTWLSECTFFLKDSPLISSCPFFILHMNQHAFAFVPLRVCMCLCARVCVLEMR